MHTWTTVICILGPNQTAIQYKIFHGQIDLNTGPGEANGGAGEDPGRRQQCQEPEKIPNNLQRNFLNNI